MCFIQLFNIHKTKKEKEKEKEKEEGEFYIHRTLEIDSNCS